MYIPWELKCAERSVMQDILEMQWRMLQKDSPADYVIATGRQESVRKFVELSTKALGWHDDNNNTGIIWEGEGINEIGRRADNGKVVIKIDPRYFRPCEVETLLGDPSKASRELGWNATTTLEELVNEMIQEDLSLAKQEVLILNKGFDVNPPKENPPNFRD